MFARHPALSIDCAKRVIPTLPSLCCLREPVWPWSLLRQGIPGCAQAIMNH